MSRTLRWSWGGEAVSYERGTPVGRRVSLFASNPCTPPRGGCLRGGHARYTLRTGGDRGTNSPPRQELIEAHDRGKHRLATGRGLGADAPVPHRSKKGVNAHHHHLGSDPDSSVSHTRGGGGGTRHGDQLNDRRDIGERGEVLGTFRKGGSPELRLLAQSTVSQFIASLGTHELPQNNRSVN